MKLLCLLMLCVLPMPAQFRPERRYALTAGTVAQSIVQALARQGVAVAVDRVSVLANVVAKEPEPALDVLSIERNPGEQTAIRLACRVPGSCVPFYASVRWPGEAPVLSSVSRARPGMAFLKAGARATMCLQDERTQISFAVITLESGAAGQTIRVASTDRKRIYRAEVVSAGIVRGSF